MEVRREGSERTIERSEVRYLMSERETERGKRCREDKDTGRKRREQEFLEAREAKKRR